MYKLTPRRKTGDAKEGADAEILLVSMVHLADQDYYIEIMREAGSFDRVLFELIAGPDVSGLDSDGNRAVTEYVYPTREQVRLVLLFHRLHVLPGVPHSMSAPDVHDILVCLLLLGEVLLYRLLCFVCVAHSWVV